MIQKSLTLLLIVASIIAGGKATSSSCTCPNELVSLEDKVKASEYQFEGQIVDIFQKGIDRFFRVETFDSCGNGMPQYVTVKTSLQGNCGVHDLDMHKKYTFLADDNFQIDQCLWAGDEAFSTVKNWCKSDVSLDKVQKKVCGLCDKLKEDKCDDDLPKPCYGSDCDDSDYDSDCSVKSDKSRKSGSDSDSGSDSGKSGKSGSDSDCDDDIYCSRSPFNDELYRKCQDDCDSKKDYVCAQGITFDNKDVAKCAGFKDTVKGACKPLWQCDNECKDKKYKPVCAFGKTFANKEVAKCMGYKKAEKGACKTLSQCDNECKDKKYKPVCSLSTGKEFDNKEIAKCMGYTDLCDGKCKK
mmetsp:Transcript_9424/g.35002  ORF Transcript_9424/g.35002 Transcript_9424/m.35002 type:complete len:355 (-) Transcript_9424:379-1443(-)|eukprot:CAMPEP_0117438262 /NCGR_PEP_ID=MMETSP0759-20121206/1962_1 /TAXON_ID=63605 /ORGANISM="Percolomonas cosmopolitus, Strain WS" /LENGTH=354 /DNA_ID=CAMNT_0005229947 /DNA_START=271 /DNA_END=1335 /DNA_ORIENTATION=-